MKINLVLASFLLSFTTMFGQVTSVSYDLKFNSNTKHFDVYLNILEGNVSSPRERMQFNSQISIILPNNTSIAISESHLPLIDNASNRGTKAMDWLLNNHLKNVKALKGNSIYSFTPDISKAASYNNMKSGESVKLFSLEISPLPADLSSVRIYKNNVDPGSSQLEGSDFSNGFTLGSVNQLYTEVVKETVITTPTKEVEITNGSSIYPNPAVDKVNLTINAKVGSKVVANVYDINGKMVIKNAMNEKLATASQTASIPLNLTPGFYNMTVVIDGQSTDHKFIVVK